LGLKDGLVAYANDDGNFVLVVPLSCGAKILKIVLELELELVLDCREFGSGTKGTLFGSRGISVSVEACITVSSSSSRTISCLAERYTSDIKACPWLVINESSHPFGFVSV
jgi:hypothetical protein